MCQIFNRSPCAHIEFCNKCVESFFSPLFLNQVFSEILVLVGRLWRLHINKLWFYQDLKDVIFHNKVITMVFVFSLIFLLLFCRVNPRVLPSYFLSLSFISCFLPSSVFPKIHHVLGLFLSGFSLPLIFFFLDYTFLSLKLTLIFCFGVFHLAHIC